MFYRVCLVWHKRSGLLRCNALVIGVNCSDGGLGSGLCVGFGIVLAGGRGVCIAGVLGSVLGVGLGGGLGLFFCVCLVWHTRLGLLWSHALVIGVNCSDGADSYCTLMFYKSKILSCWLAGGLGLFYRVCLVSHTRSGLLRSNVLVIGVNFYQFKTIKGNFCVSFP